MNAFNEAQWLLFEQYQCDELTPDERQAVDTQLEQDADFRTAWEAMTVFLGDIRYLQQIEIRERISRVDQNLENEGFFITPEEITGWLNGKATPDVTAAIEKRLQADASFAADVEAMKDIQAAVRETHRDDVFKRIGAVMDAVDAAAPGTGGGTGATEPPPLTVINSKKQHRFRYFIAAAASLILVAAVIWLMQKPTNQLYDTYFTTEVVDNSPEKDSTGHLGMAGNLRRIDPGLTAYTNGSYKTAIKLLTAEIPNLPKGSSTYEEARYYDALARMQEHDFKNAEKELEELAAIPNSHYYDGARWHLALIYQMSGRKTAAINLLEGLKNTQYSGKAEELLPKLQE